MKKYFLLLLLFCSLSAFSQNLLKVADSLLHKADYSGTLVLLENIQNKSEDEVFILENRKADALIHLGKFEDAEKLLKDLEKRSSAEFLHGIVLINFGLLYINQGRNDLATEALKQAINLFEKVGKANSLEAAHALNYLGLVFKFTGKHSQAQEQLQRALAIRQGLLKNNHELIAASYNDLGLVFVGIDNDKALDYYEKALKIYETLHGKEHPKIANASINIGFIYRNLELYGDAINNFENAFKIWEKIYPKANPTKAFALLNLGDTYLKMGNNKSAKGYYERSLEMYKESYGDKHPEVAQALNALGTVELAADHYDIALKYYQKALIANAKDFESTDERQNPQLKNYYHGNRLLYSLLYKAQAFEKRYFGKTLRLGDLTNSITTLQYCDSLIDKLRQQSTNESDKIALGVIANEVYADGVRISFETSQNSLNKKPFLEMAFYFAEKSKSAVLLEAISDADAKSFAGIPSDLMEEEKNLKSAIALTAQKLSQKPSIDEEKYLMETSYNLNRSFENFTKKLEQQFPQYFNLKFNSASPSLKQIQALLNPNTAVLSYFIDDKNSRIYIFIISQKKYELIDRAIPKDFDKYITGLRNSLFFNSLKTYTFSATKLSDILLPPHIPNAIKSLVILPTGRLSIVPFETLFTRDSHLQLNYHELPYLVNKFNIRYEFSASLILQKSRNKVSTESPSIFLCAPVTFPKKDDLAELPGTESEVKEISQLFQSKNLIASVNVGQQANESVVKNNTIQNYNLLHFATHGVVDEVNPELSRIFLQSSSEAEDGNLFSGEIYNLNLKANLVTLSACQTGLGKISKGEGVVGLSRALVYAGAKSIIVSFWSVADESTAELMKDFYKQLLSDSESHYSGSLRAAKLNLIKNEKYAAPYFWAPFILIGF